MIYNTKAIKAPFGRALDREIMMLIIDNPNDGITRFNLVVGNFAIRDNANARQDLTGYTLTINKDSLGGSIYAMPAE
jgi:hypothetical protein